MIISRRSTRSARDPGIPSLLFAMLALFAGALPSAADARTTQKITTPGGVSFWLVEERGIPLVALDFAIRGGASLDPSGKEGATGLLASMLDEGAGDLDADAFKQRLESLGSRLSFSASHLAFRGSLLSLSKHIDTSAGLMKLALQSPALEAEDFERAKQQQTAAIAIANRRAGRVAVDKFTAIAFSGHPYGRPVDGTAETIANVTVADIRDQHGRVVTRTDLHVVIVGDIDAEAASDLVDTIFADLPEREKTAPIPPADLKTFTETLPAAPGQEEATAVFSLPMPPHATKDFFTAMTLNEITGSGGFDARLTKEVRVKRGLTYAISSQIVADPASSMSIGVVSTEPDRMDETIEVIKSVLTQMQADGPEPRELENAVNGLNGSYLLAIDTSARLASRLTGLWVQGLGEDYIEQRQQNLNAVTLEDARKVASEIYDVGKLSLLIMRPQD